MEPGDRDGEEVIELSTNNLEFSVWVTGYTRGLQGTHFLEHLRQLRNDAVVLIKKPLGVARKQKRKKCADFKCDNDDDLPSFVEVDAAAFDIDDGTEVMQVPTTKIRMVATSDQAAPVRMVLDIDAVHYVREKLHHESQEPTRRKRSPCKDGMGGRVRGGSVSWIKEKQLWLARRPGPGGKQETSTFKPANADFEAEVEQPKREAKEWVHSPIGVTCSISSSPASGSHDSPP